MVDIEVLDHGMVWFEATDAALDHGEPDPRVSAQLTPDEAEDIAQRLLAAASTIRRKR